MEKTRTGISNLALSMLDITNISDINDATSKAARYCKQFFEGCYDEVLEAHDWMFASRRVPLTRLSSTPAFGFAYEFQLPDDFCRVISIYTDSASNVRVPYSIEQHKLLCDLDSCNLHYVAKVEALMGASPASFCMMVAYKLKALLATPLLGVTAGEAKAKEALSQYAQALADAKMNDGSGGETEEINGEQYWTDKAGFTGSSNIALS